MILDEIRFNEFICNFEFERQDDLIVIHSKFRTQSVSFTCDEDGSGLDFSENFFYAQKGKKNKIVDYVQIELTDEQLTKVQKEVNSYIEEVNNEDIIMNEEREYWSKRGGYDPYNDRGINRSDFF